MRVLIIICTGFIPWGGLTTVAMNYYRAMNRENLIIDFASNNDAPELLINEIESCGSRYIQLPPRTHICQYVNGLYQAMKGYDVVHIHGNSATMSLELFPAILRKIPRRIVHCHTTNPTAKKLHWLLRPFFLRMYTQGLAVSEEAGEWIYGKNKFEVLNNAISIEKYCFNNKIREEVRSYLGLSEFTIVIGNVGKINNPKNHNFMLDIFAEVKKKLENTKLLLVGDGPLRKNIEIKASLLGISNDVIFVGMSNEPEKWLQGMDCFLFPSNWEGLGLALLEAQANGLKCYASDAVPKLANATETVCYISLQNSAEYWAEIICSGTFSRIPDSTIKTCFKNAHLDISFEADRLRDFYLAGRNHI